MIDQPTIGEVRGEYLAILIDLIKRPADEMVERCPWLPPVTAREAAAETLEKLFALNQRSEEDYGD